MRHPIQLAAAALLFPLLATPALAQQVVASSSSTASSDTTTSATTKKPETKSAVSLAAPIVIQHYRPDDQRGINVFETPKQDGVGYDGFKLSFGAAFAQEFQGLQHKNTATPVLVNGVNQNSLVPIGNGFNNAVANLYINAQIAPGIRVAMTSYLSARHHQETWVKDGYALIDQSPIDYPLLNTIMKYTTLKVGHFQIDYGDQQSRRTDNGEAMYNPFVGNLIMDAFTTEIGGEVFLRNNGFLAMGGITGGEVHGQVTTPQKRSESYLGKIGFDKQPLTNLRVRLTGSFYANAQSASNTLYTGDRGGSPYYDVLENGDGTSYAWSGNLRNGLSFSNNVHAYVLNPFVKLGGVEYFGNFETATGRSAAETKNRTLRQVDNDLVYRFLDNKVYVGGRYNSVTGTLQNYTHDININRASLAAGWFVTPLMLTKVEYSKQFYNDFNPTDIRNGGEFKGFVVSAVLAF